MTDDINGRYLKKDSRRSNKLIADLFRNFQAKLPLIDETLESPKKAPKEIETQVLCSKLSGKYTEGYEGLR